MSIGARAIMPRILNRLCFGLWTVFSNKIFSCLKLIADSWTLAVGREHTLVFFLKQGFYARGVDISKRDTEFGRIRYPHLGGRLQTCESAPDANSYYGWENGIDVVIASQSLYYLSEADFQKTLTKLYDAMAPGGIIFASMMGTDHTYYKHSEPTDDSSLRKVNFEGTRFSVHNYVSFTESAEALQKRFLIFDKVRTGQYMMELEEGESNNFHWVFIGQKNS